MPNSYTNRLSGALAWALALGSGCADILDIPDMPMLIEPDAWACDAPEALPASPQPERATVRVHACNFITSNCTVPVTGLTVSLCNKRDFNCSVPLQQNIHDVNGDITVEVPTSGSLGKGFDGYLLVRSKNELCTNEAAFGGPGACTLAPMCDVSAPDEKHCAVPTFSPALLFFNPPITNDVPNPIVLPLVPTVAGVALTTAGGAQSVDPSLGVVFATGLDCDGMPASGLTFTVRPIPPKLGAVYVSNGVIDATATQTDGAGIGGLLGIPSGFVQVSAYAAGREVAMIGAQVLPQSISYITLTPTQMLDGATP